MKQLDIAITDEPCHVADQVPHNQEGNVIVTFNVKGFPPICLLHLYGLTDALMGWKSAAVIAQMIVARSVGAHLRKEREELTSGFNEQFRPQRKR